MLSNSERKLTADRLWKIIGQIDSGASLSTIREAVRFTAFALEESAWDRRIDMEAAL